jgi:ABC-2 type transport system ATP-binding protein
MPEKNLIIDAYNLKKKFANNVAVKDISIQVERGDIFGFIGPNGSGKTTTIRMLCGLLVPDEGSGTCLGYDILTEAKLIMKHVGYIPQNFSLYKKLTVYENILFMAEIYGVINRNERISILMDQFNLTAHSNKLSGSLSGGWKQRLSFACALIHDPHLLLLDEPTASVDPKARRDFWELVHTLSSEGMTILLSSHNMDEVERCHRIAYVCNGSLLMTGSISEIIKTIDLMTWEVRGSNLTLLARQLEATAGVDQVVTFFDRLHVSSKNHEHLKQGLTPYLNKGDYSWKITKSTLDDVFVWLSKVEFEKDEANENASL